MERGRGRCKRRMSNDFLLAAVFEVFLELTVSWTKITPLVESPRRSVRTADRLILFVSASSAISSTAVRPLSWINNALGFGNSEIRKTVSIHILYSVRTVKAHRAQCIIIIITYIYIINTDSGERINRESMCSKWIMQTRRALVAGAVNHLRPCVENTHVYICTRVITGSMTPWVQW